jgi:hypothetical protein
MPILIEQTRYKPIPTGKYSAKIINIEEDNRYKDNPKLQFTFEISPNEEGKTRTIFGWVNMKFNPKSTLYKWTQAAFGGEPIDPSYRFNSDELIGNKVNIAVEVLEKNDDTVTNKIVNVSPSTEKQSESVPHPEVDMDW